MYGQKATILLFCNNSNNSIEGPKKLLSTEFKPETQENDDFKRTHGYCGGFFQSEERQMVSGNPKGNSNLILLLQKRLAGQLCCQITRGADFIVLIS